MFPSKRRTSSPNAGTIRNLVQGEYTAKLYIRRHTFHQTRELCHLCMHAAFGQDAAIMPSTRQVLLRAVSQQLTFHGSRS